MSKEDKEMVDAAGLLEVVAGGQSEAERKAVCENLMVGLLGSVELLSSNCESLLNAQSDFKVPGAVADEMRENISDAREFAVRSREYFVEELALSSSLNKE